MTSEVALEKAVIFFAASLSPHETKVRSAQQTSVLSEYLKSRRESRNIFMFQILEVSESGEEELNSDG